MCLERFEDYYGGSPEIPPVQTAPLEYLIFMTVLVKTERIAILQQGECDIITHEQREKRICQGITGEIQHI